MPAGDYSELWPPSSEAFFIAEFLLFSQCRLEYGPNGKWTPVSI